ncbi:hypothetical protein ISN44_As11g034620 [Arabidopsis suecica]|uniref:Uncharacterized protein n=1 Tax=Arabidopsis suecica TaxID=45249 RepID=A0A8T1ZH42_ARASU|nr:hypothetical protein ISN44_As11g034620 [Arabidopsis suecica]
MSIGLIRLWKYGGIGSGNVDVCLERSKCRDQVKFVKERRKEVSRAHTLVQKRNVAGLATAGGVLRDMTGKWYAGFALNNGVCSAPLAELWGCTTDSMMALHNFIQDSHRDDSDFVRWQRTKKSHTHDDDDDDDDDVGSGVAGVVVMMMMLMVVEVEVVVVDML